jgi:chromosomal replication initiator protein
VEQPIELTAETLWTEVAGRLKGALNDSTYRTWFGEVEGLEVTDDTFVLAVPNDFTREWIEGHFIELMRAAVRDATGQQRRIQLTVAETGAVPDTAKPAQRVSEAGLNTKYTFDLFVIGSSNRFAQPHSQSPKRRRKRTTRSSSTARRDWGRPTCSRRSPST